MLQNQAQDLNEMAEEAQDLSRVEQETIELAEARERALVARKEKDLDAEAEINICAGRIQATKVITTFAEVLTVSQLRRIKELGKEAGKTWKEVCDRIGISTKMADQYLRLGADLGDDFVADVSAIGVSIRTLEAARKLPEDVRKRLTSGEVVDLEEVSKEELTEVIKDLAQENRKALDAKDELLEDETKARRKAENNAKETQQRLEATAQELANLKAGLPADDAEAIAAIQNMESKIIPMLMVLRYTSMEGRSPEAKARIIASVSLVEETSKWTGNSLAAKAEGFEPDDDRLGRHARMTADEIAASDGKTVPGF